MSPWGNVTLPPQPMPPPLPTTDIGMKRSWANLRQTNLSLFQNIGWMGQKGKIEEHV